MEKKIGTCIRIAFSAYVVRSVLWFIGRGSYSTENGLRFRGNEVLTEIGDQFFQVVCALAAFYLVAVFLCRTVGKVVGLFRALYAEWSSSWDTEGEDAKGKEMGEKMSGTSLHSLMNLEATTRARGNYFFLASIVTFFTGIVFIGIGAVFAYGKTGTYVLVVLIAAGIMVEIVSACFGFMYYQLWKQITFVHRLINKREQFERLMDAAERADDRDAMIVKILEKSSENCAEDRE